MPFNAHENKAKVRVTDPFWGAPKRAAGEDVSTSRSWPSLDIETPSQPKAS